MLDSEIQMAVSEVRAFMEARANEVMAQKYSRYFTEGYDPYGITQSDLEQLKRSLLEQYQLKFGLTGFLDLGDQLFASGKYEEGGLAVSLVAAMKKQYDRETLPRIGNWLENQVRNWAHNDMICSAIIAPLWKSDLITLDDIKPWLVSTSKWSRRSAAVGIIPQVKQTEDATIYLNFIRPLMMDNAREVQQGTGWMLRETWKQHPEQTEALLLEYKDVSPRLIFQYATEKMCKEDKARFKANKNK